MPWLRWANVSHTGRRCGSRRRRRRPRARARAVEHERREADAGSRSRAANTSSAPAICGTRCGLTKLAASMRARPAAGEAVAELAANSGASVGLVLEPVARADVADGDVGRAHPLSLRRSAAAAAARERRQRHRDHQRAAVEELLDEVLDAEQLQSGDPGHQEVHRDEGADRVEAPGPDRGRAEEAGRERGQQERLRRGGVGAAEAARVHDPRETGEETADDERAPANPVDAQAAQARHAAAATDEQQTPAERRVLEDVEQDQRRRDPVEEDQVEAEERLAYRPVVRPPARFVTSVSLLIH